MASSPTQPDPAEGARDDGGSPKEKGVGEGVSATDPAEGADDIPAGDAGHIDGAADPAA